MSLFRSLMQGGSTPPLLEPLVYFDVRKQGTVNSDESNRNTLVDYSGKGNNGTLNYFNFEDLYDGYFQESIDSHLRFSNSSTYGVFDSNSHIFTVTSENQQKKALFNSLAVTDLPSGQIYQFPSYKVKVQGIGTGVIRIGYYNQIYTSLITISSDGTYTVPGYSDKVVERYNIIPFYILIISPVPVGCTLEFLPQTEYIQFNPPLVEGPIEYITLPSNNTQGYKTVFALVEIPENFEQEQLYWQNSGSTGLCSIDIFPSQVVSGNNPDGDCFINGKLNTQVVGSSLGGKIILITCRNQNNLNMASPRGEIGYTGGWANHFKLYKFLGFSECLTDSQINQIIDDYGLMELVDYIDVQSSVPGFVGGWKGYGRSNSEDPATRDILPDYSGNGRDIRLYNFDFSGMSGWNGYAENYLDTKYIYKDRSYVRTDHSIVAGPKEIAEGTPSYFYGGNSNASDSSEVCIIRPHRIKVVGMSPGEQLQYLYIPADNPASSRQIIFIKEDGIYDLPGSVAYTGTIEPAQSTLPIGLRTDLSIASTITIEQLPTYPGGLVSDGVDDYGQCIKGFALPDDYTVVAVRKFINFNQAALAEKSRGAFSFEYGSASTFSYGKLNYVTFPPLFSYQTKNSYNGNELIALSDSDSDDNPLVLFKTVFTSDYKSVALYDLRIYDHTLTAEELQTVKDEMMSDYEKNAKPLEGITYVADWDAKGRYN